MRALIGLAIIISSWASFAKADDVTPASSPSPTPVLDRVELNALMKHPTEPHYDRLLPMSGRWTRCEKAEGGGARQDRFSSTDRSHFFRVIAVATDAECKVIKSEQRFSYECDPGDTAKLSCNLTKFETREGESVWKTLPPPADSPKTVFIELRPEAKKRRTKSGAKSGAPGGASRQLEVRLTPVAVPAKSTEVFILTFAPAAARPKPGS